MQHSRRSSHALSRARDALPCRGRQSASSAKGPRLKRSSVEIQLVWPNEEHLDEYVAALERGWSPDNLRQQAAQEELARIASDPEGFLALQVDHEGAGPVITLPEGITVPRLPGYRRWMWDGEFC